MRCVLQQDLAFGASNDYWAPSSAKPVRGLQKHGSPVRPNDEKRAIWRPGPSLTLPAGHATPSSGAAESCAHEVREDKRGAPVREKLERR